MPKRETKLQRRIDRLIREKHELLSKIEQLLRERDDEPDPALNAIRQGKRRALRIIKQEH
ncbi:hypothetical protein MYX82_08105 [Acidobacteria bacterium AH-259-D05]|nr:hypothetical protein [Acidobacteria bacterium AH-259-D05]